MAGRVAIRLFATAREAVGVEQLQWTLPEGGASVRNVVDALGGRYRRLRPILGSCRYFLNGELVRQPSRRPLVDGDELAIHPPYSGG